MIAVQRFHTATDFVLIRLLRVFIGLFCLFGIESLRETDCVMAHAEIRWRPALFSVQLRDYFSPEPIIILNSHLESLKSIKRKREARRMPHPPWLPFDFALCFDDLWLLLGSGYTHLTGTQILFSSICTYFTILTSFNFSLSFPRCLPLFVGV